MAIKRFSAITIVAAFAMGGMVGQPVGAQPMPTFEQPAEFPPASFGGRQYVDSTGCAFVRAGSGQAVAWIPRVGPDRRKACGLTPTAVARPDLPVIADAAGPAQTAAPTASRPVIVASAPRSAAAQYTPPRTEGPLLRPRPVGGAAPVARHPQRHAQPGAAHPVRVQSPGRGVSHADIAASVAHVPPAPAIAPPRGYRNAWEDDRLNPDRGKQTLRGAMQTALVWTQTVPRRLVDNTGRDRTRDYDYLVYPYTDYGKQKRDLAGGQHVTVRFADGQRMILHKSEAERLQRQSHGAAVTPRVSSKSVRAATPAPRDAAGTAGRHVQVATFGNPANAGATVQRLQRSGLPVATRRAGGGLQVVLVGPFADAAQGQSALAAVRQAGFPDAFLR